VENVPYYEHFSTIALNELNHIKEVFDKLNEILSLENKDVKIEYIL